MSPSILFSFLTTLLLLLLSPPSTAAAAVHDTDGDILSASSYYHIVPVFRGRGGGLGLNSKNDSVLCPLYVVQEGGELSLGLPTRFTPWNSKQGFVSLSSRLHIEFRAFTICIQSTAWRLAPDEETGRIYVATGGGRDWFEIEKVESGEEGVDDYKIVYCPGGGDVLCGDVGVFFEGERRLLGLTDEPLLVRFKKVQEEIAL